MRGMLLTVNSGHGQEVKEGAGGTKGGSRSGTWGPALAVMGLRAFLIICLLLLADAQKWPVQGDCKPCKCFYNRTSYGRLRSVNCSQRGLKAIPTGLPHDLMALDLSWNSLDITKLDSLCKFRFLQSLTLSFADLTSLSDVLKNCSTVLEINLAGNRLNQIDAGTFQGLRNLRRLLGLEVDIILQDDVFVALKNLKDLDLRFHGKSLPDKLFDRMVIQSLNLVLTQATALPKGIFQFGKKTLNAVQIVGERITTLHDELLDGLSVLRRLYLTMPSVENLPERFFHSQQQQDKEPTRRANLQEVEITGIKTLPPRLFNQLVNLETLQLREIGSFPQTAFLAEVINLRMLVITGSKLARIPADWFLELYSLKTLKLAKNELEELDDNAFKGLLNLINLDLSYNNLLQVTGKMLEPISRTLDSLILTSNILTEIHEDWISGLHSLRFLDVSENRLANVNADSFVGMTYLSVLSLNNNRLTYLSNNLFKDQIQLESLSVADNYFVEFPKAILRLKKSLVNVDLSSNTIQQVPAVELCQFLYLEVVTILDNNLNCDCDMFAFHQCPKVVVEAQCQTPKDYLDMYFKDIAIPDSCQLTKQVVSEVSTTLSQIVVPGTQQPELEKVTEAAQDTSNSQGSTGVQDQENPNRTIIKELFPEDTDSSRSQESRLNKTSLNHFDSGLATDADAQTRGETSSGKDGDHTTTLKTIVPPEMSKEDDDLESKKGVDVQESTLNKTSINHFDSGPLATDADAQTRGETSSGKDGDHTTTLKTIVPPDMSKEDDDLESKKSVDVQESTLNKTSINHFDSGPLATDADAQTRGETSSGKDGDHTTTLKTIVPPDMSKEDDDLESKKSVDVKEESGLSEETSTQRELSSTPAVGKEENTPSLVVESDDKLSSPASSNEGTMMQDGPTETVTKQVGSTENRSSAMLRTPWSQTSSTLTSVQINKAKSTLANPTQKPSQQPQLMQPTVAQPIMTQEQSTHGAQHNPDAYLEGKKDSSGSKPFNSGPALNRNFMEDYSADDAQPAGPSNQAPESVDQEAVTPQEIGKGDKENTNQKSEKVAFNFTISALAAMLVFGCCLLVVFAVRRWQQKGSYIVSRQESDDTEMNQLDGAAGDESFGKPLEGQMDRSILERPGARR